MIRRAPRRWWTPHRIGVTGTAVAALLMLAFGLALVFSPSGDPSAPTSAPDEMPGVLADVPGDLLEHAHNLLDLSDEEFTSLLLAEVEEPSGG